MPADRIRSESFSTLICAAFVNLNNYVIGFVRNNTSWTIQATAYLASVGYIASTTYQTIFNETEDMPLAIARSSGAAIKYVLVPTVVVPVCRVLMSTIQNTNLSRYLGLNLRHVSHKNIAGLIIGASITHSVAHYFANSANYFKQTGITGMTMLSCLAAPLGGMFVLRRSTKVQELCSYGTQVMRPHQIGAMLFLGAYAVHTPDLRLLPYAIGIVGGYALDNALKFIYYTHIAQTRKIAVVKGTDFMLLQLERPPHFKTFIPGNYALLSLPNINGLLEHPHPFTIVNDDNMTLEFLIKKNGVWTERLFKLIQSNEAPSSLRWNISGPYGSKLSNFYKKSYLTIIGMGVGITPYLSYLNWLINKNFTMPMLSIHISQKKVEELTTLLDLLRRINLTDQKIIKSIDLYVTGENKNLKDKLKTLSQNTNIHFNINPKNDSEQKHDKTSDTRNRKKENIESKPFVLFAPTNNKQVAIDILKSDEKNLHINRESLNISEDEEKKLNQSEAFNLNESPESQKKILFNDLDNKYGEVPSVAHKSLLLFSPRMILDEKDLRKADKELLCSPEFEEDKENHSNINRHKIFSINLHIKRINLADVISTADNDISICANPEFTIKAKNIAYRYGKKISYESF